MNNESKCCPNCRKYGEDSVRLGVIWVCSNPSCECHTPAPEDWEEKARAIYKTCLEIPGKNLAFEDYILPFIRSEKAAARREGAERAVEYVKDKVSWREYISRMTLMEILDAARSEGVNEKI